MKRIWNLAPVLQIVQKDCWKLLPLLISINWPSLETLFFVVQKIYWKMHPVSCNTQHDVTDLENHGMVKITKTWISWERNITFLQNKNILNLYLRWYILRSYCFVSEVTFNNKSTSSGVFIVNFECLTRCSSVFVFADFEYVNAGWNTLFPASKFIYVFQSWIYNQSQNI